MLCHHCVLQLAEIMRTVAASICGKSVFALTDARLFAAPVASFDGEFGVADVVTPPVLDPPDSFVVDDPVAPGVGPATPSA